MHFSIYGVVRKKDRLCSLIAHFSLMFNTIGNDVEFLGVKCYAWEERSEEWRVNVLGGPFRP